MIRAQYAKGPDLRTGLWVDSEMGEIFTTMLRILVEPSLAITPRGTSMQAEVGFRSYLCSVET